MRSKSHCLVKKCKRQYLCKGYCEMHYLRFHRGYDVGNEKPRKAENGTWNISKGREYRKRYSKEYRRQHPWIKSIDGMNEIRFGGLKDFVLVRDKYACQICGMTDKEHYKKWGCHITVDHLDGTGRYSDEHNNSMKNLWTLCLRCHGRRDRLRYLLSLGKPIPDEVIKILKLE